MSESDRYEEASSEDRARFEAARRNNQVNFKALLMTLAIVMAPFVALLISLELALAVLAAALLFSTGLTLWVSKHGGASLRGTLRMGAGLNFVVFLVVVALLVLRLTQ